MIGLSEIERLVIHSPIKHLNSCKIIMKKPKAFAKKHRHKHRHRGRRESFDPNPEVEQDNEAQELVEQSSGSELTATATTTTRNNISTTSNNNVPPIVWTTGSLKNNLLTILSALLIIVSLIEIVFIPIGDRISKRYAWDLYEPHVTTLLVFMGLSSSCGMLLGIFIMFFHIGSLKNGTNHNGTILIFVGVSGILTFISFIYSISQFLASGSLFGSNFLKLITEYKSSYPEKVTMDRIQIEFECCGLRSEQDWTIVAIPTELGEGFIPFSCCNPSTLRACNHENSGGQEAVNKLKTENNMNKLTIYEPGCRSALQNYYGFLVSFVIWTSGICLNLQVALFITCYLANRKSK